MNLHLSEQQISSYRENGFLIMPEFLRSDELEELRSAVDSTMSSMGKRKVAVDSDDLHDEDSDTDRIFIQKMNLWRSNPVVRKYLLDANLGRLLCSLADVEGIRVWHDQALVKEPFSPPTFWHLDTPYWSFHSRRSISIWIALDDATPHNGCLYFVPRSHEQTRFENVGAQAKLGSLFDIYPALKSTWPVGAPIPAGGCTFHNGLTAHGAGANMTPGRRRAMTCAYMPDGSVFNGIRNILPKPYAESLAVGAPLDDDRLNPLLYRDKR